jgi:hypothetical protein
MFRELERAFAARRIEVQQNVAGADPEQVLVIETIGSIENFANAVRKIQGLEWLGEVELDEIAPDEDFYDEQHHEKKLTGRLYLIMTNLATLQSLLSLWRRYNRHEDMEFQRGLTKFRNVFDNLKDLRRWDVRDRLEGTGVLHVWREALRLAGREPIRFEAELWFRGSSERREADEGYLRNLVTGVGGRVITQCVLPTVAYHAILGELPRRAVQEILNDPSTELVKCDGVMFYRPTGQMCAGERRLGGDPETLALRAGPLPTGDPVVGILDGLPLENHSSLSGRLVLDDPDDWASQYPARDRVHGTGMASLVVHGDLNANEAPLPSPVYVRPIMQPSPADQITPRREFLPSSVLAVDLVHRAVRRLFEGEESGGPAAPTVKIINLSIGDPYRQFDRAMSPLARLLDWLSVKYGVLFVVSAGNCVEDIELPVNQVAFDAWSADERENAVVKAVLSAGHLRRLLSPAESVNAITVGALHSDLSEIRATDRRINPFVRPLPSPVSPLGSGYRRSVKPDILHVGGRQLYNRSLAGQTSKSTRLELSPLIAPPGCRVARPGRQGELDVTGHCVGTSNAAALVSRHAALCYRTLLEVLNDQAPQSNFEPSAIPLLKALLVHGASWGDMSSRLSQIVEAGNDARRERRLLTRWLGYGPPDFGRALSCTAQRATVLGFGSPTDGAGHLFSLPFPPSLGSRKEWRRLTVTLGWLTPTAPNTQRYRTGSLWFEVISSDRIEATRTDVDWQAARRGTVQHEVFEGEQAVALADGDALTIKVNCRKDAAPINEPIPYGLVVSLEVAEGVNVAVYEEVRSRIVVPVRVRPRAGTASG